MTDEQVLAYVRAVAPAVGLPLDEAQAQRVAMHLARTAAFARMLDAAGLGEADEPAEIYRPAPFPEAGS
jgi:hypothetical protein